MKLTLKKVRALYKQKMPENRRAALRAMELVLRGSRVADACARCGVSERSYYALKALVLGNEATFLKPRSRRPKRSPRRSKGWLVHHIVTYRKRWGWGAECIAAHLFHDHSVKTSPRTVSRILKRKGLIEVCKRKPKNKHTRRYELHHPGELTQMDVKYLPYKINGETKYIYNFIDKASRWSFKRAFDSYGPSETALFFKDLIAHCPFTIQSLQTDNGIEFTNRFVALRNDGTLGKEHVLDELCREHGIRHKLIPPGEKELNGCVERNHRTDADELYSRTFAHSIKELQSMMIQRTATHNEKRRYKATNWRTPNQFLADYLAANIAIARLAQEKCQPADQSWLQAA